MCDQQTTELCDNLQSIAIATKADPAFDAWVRELSQRLINKAVIAEQYPVLSLREMYDLNLPHVKASWILEYQYNQRVAYEALQQREATIAAALAALEAERYRLWFLLGKQLDSEFAMELAPVYPESEWPQPEGTTLMADSSHWDELLKWAAQKDREARRFADEQDAVTQ